MSKVTPHLNLFRPGEAEAITGLSAAMQRDYRHRGFLPKFVGHARFNIFDLAEMYMLKRLSDAGFWPEVFGPLAKIAATGLAFYALKMANAYEGNQADIEQFCAISNRPELKIFETLGLDAEVSKYLVIWATPVLGVAEHEFSDDLNASFSEDVKGSGRAFLQQDGPVTVFNLQYLSHHLLASGFEGKAFVRLSSAAT
ncbi:hypothetical protein V5F32_14555 [Xanthobacter oligotrophicus]|uniref:Uncharacterized protein n=1 Tax=Xanthobacter oligotrophicus TaxID=2607286 RepID=A0ABW6ZXA8_9HYPH